MSVLTGSKALIRGSILSLAAALPLAAFLFFRPAAVSAQTTVQDETETGTTDTAEPAAPEEPAPVTDGGTGLQAGGKDTKQKGPAPSKKDEDESKFEPKFAPCQADDVGTDSLWKYPSESWGTGAAFIPPNNACKTQEIVDGKGKKTGQYKLLWNHISGIYMCEDKGCVSKLNFETIGIGEFCVWRVHKSAWTKFFGSRPFGVVMVLEDGRFIRWDLKNPSARNGMPPYRDLKHVVRPYCYTPLY